MTSRLRPRTCRLSIPSLLALPFASLGVLGCASEPPPPAAQPLAPPPPAAPAPVADEPLPGVRLPSDTRPTHESLVLTVDPTLDRFRGAADIDVTLDRPRTTIWLHGKGLHVSRATVTPEGGQAIDATWKQREESGTAALTLSTPVPAGRATIHVEYDAPFGPKGEGLYKVTSRGVPYAFTQHESIAARYTFPCFDEPGFKLPWDETLVVPAGSVAIANTKEAARVDVGGQVRVSFARTVPLPSYLVAFAVGPFDVVAGTDAPPNAVRKRPLPVRAITTKGRGAEVAYALAHTGEILATLEGYFGLEYPFDKLDILAVPEKGGAMENPGAVTFADALLLFDEKTAPLRQKRGYASVMAHELAHQWVGDLVTAAWWDDIWMNEAFATWIGSKATDLWDPTMDQATALASGVDGAMGSDSLVSARAIRQPIASTNDIENAFDGITYQKGGGVLSMFERFVGPDVFRKGLHDYLSQHAFGSGTADDFLAAESAASGKDLKTPFHTFLDQPGVPFVEASVTCAPKTASLHLRQSRYLLAGSTGDAAKTWQIPVCARYRAGKETKQACTLLTEREGDLPLGDVCPAWVFPNAEGAGYYRFSLAPADLAKLRKEGFGSLSTRERMALGNSTRAGFASARLPMKDAILADAPFATDPHREVASEPMRLLSVAREWLYDDAAHLAVERYGRSLFLPVASKIGWDRGKNDDGDRLLLRASVLGFLATTARDPGVRAEARKRGRAFLGYGKDGAIHREALDANLVPIAMTVVGEEADAAEWGSLKALLAKTEDTQVRGWLLAALSSPRDASLLARVRELALDPVLRSNEAYAPVWAQLREPSTREAAWLWVKAHFDELLKVGPKHHGQTQLIAMGGQFCDEAHADDVAAFFTDARIASIDGAPRVLASTLEDVRLCAARRKAQEPSARQMFPRR